MHKRHKHLPRSKRLLLGALIVTVGILWLLSNVGINIPEWVTEWYSIVIYVGIFIGIKSNFRNIASFILIGIGAFFFWEDYAEMYIDAERFFWPMFIIFIGLMVAFKPRSFSRCNPRRHHRLNQENENASGNQIDNDTENATKETKDDYFIDSVTVFNGIKKNVLSKSLRGGETVTIFGGVEINLMQADFNQQIELDNTVIFGGLKLIVPPSWDVQIKARSLFGSIEDKRTSIVDTVPDDKILKLSGIVLFGGIDIVNY